MVGLKFSNRLLAASADARRGRRACMHQQHPPEKEQNTFDYKE